MCNLSVPKGDHEEFTKHTTKSTAYNPLPHSQQVWAKNWSCLDKGLSERGL